MVLGAGVIVLILIVLFLALRGGNDVEDATDALADNAEVLGQLSDGGLRIDQVAVLKQAEQQNPNAGLEALARSFAERFGSFSNASDYANLEELTSFMTARMRTWAEDTVRAARAKDSAGVGAYYGIRTRAMTVSSLTVTGATARVVVDTQRREVRGEDIGEVLSQQLVLEFLQEGGAWKVDNATWGE